MLAPVSMLYGHVVAGLILILGLTTVVESTSWNHTSQPGDVNLAVMMPLTCVQGIGSTFKTGTYYASAILIAVDKVNKDPTLLPGRRLVFDMKETCCIENHTVTSMLHHLGLNTNASRPKVHAFIGPACFCSIAASTASAINIPIVSFMCNGEVIDSSAQTFARTSPVDAQLTEPLLLVLQHFGWKRVGMIYEDLQHWTILHHVLESMFEKEGIHVGIKRVVPPSLHFDNYIFQEITSTMREVKEEARVIILLCDPSMLRELMLAALDAGMIDGDHVMISIELDPMLMRRKTTVPFLWYNPNFDHTMNRTMDVIQAYEALLVLSTRSDKQSKYEEFEEKVKLLMAEEPFNVDVFSRGPEEVMNSSRTSPPIYGAYLYDAVYQYAVALNKTLAEGGDEFDGRAIVRHLHGSVYESVQGFQVRMDNLGNVGFNMTLMDFRDGQFVQVAGFEIDMLSRSNFSFSHGLLPQKLILSPNTNIIWPFRDGPPPDSPPCGFHDVLCPKDSETGSNKVTKVVIPIVCASSAIILVIVVVLFVRQHSIERKLMAQLWKINPDDLRCRAPSELALSSSNLGYTSNSGRQSHSRFPMWEVAFYQSRIVQLKRLPRKNLTLTRNMLLDLNMMKELRHDNICTFIGAMVHSESIVVVSDCPTKGTLREVLENFSIKLDTIFILSLVSDIIKGMCYLAGSPFKYHGNLTSENCLIDGRWTLKINDYGIRNLYLQPKTQDKDFDFEYLMWRAPELMRSHLSLPLGTIKGDVYSFGIILQEFHTRDGPWTGCCLPFQEIIARLCNVEEPPFRPVVHPLILNAEELRDIMKMCWEENPDLRPTFTELRKMIQRLLNRCGTKGNIIENIVYMMEHHTSNLEDLVEQKRLQLVEEKRRTDLLLEEMLPRSTVDQLRRGAPVIAESFDEVTLYFSDLVGFSDLCSQIPPMQIVDILNNLYTLFDGIIKNYEVYKVETIGDAYVVVSGLPHRNDKEHALEIALMALHLLEESSQFLMPHTKLQPQLRIGIHSGPVVAGVVGTTRPRYCLFGDTVNMASRIETTSMESMIHMSQKTRDLLAPLGVFIIVPRGEVYLKGKGNHHTYWLRGVDEAYRTARCKSRGSEVPRNHHLRPVEPQTDGDGIRGLLTPGRSPRHGTLHTFRALCRRGSSWTDAEGRADPPDDSVPLLEERGV